MRAVRHTPEGIRSVEVPVPTQVAVGDAEGVRIRPRSVGICQTDLNMVGFGPREMTFGHEFAGVLDDGTPVAIEPMVPCEVCEFCGMGDYHWCEKSHEMIVGVAFDGGMADEILLPERCLVRLPHGLDVANACLCEPLAVNIHSLMLGRLESRHRVAVVGPGITGFGLLGGAAAHWRGCVVDVEPDHDLHAVAAERMGLSVGLSGTYDVVIEGDGSERSITRAAEVARPGGTVLLVAGYYQNKLFDVLPWVVKELTAVWGTFYGHHGAGRAFDSAAALLAHRPEIAEAMITQRFPLDAAGEAFTLAASDTPTLKVVVEP
ncbi:MAG: zinc-binding dehydrogenase [bacterium]|nr:zinc-binding dehydrogenase [bacterium]